MFENIQNALSGDAKNDDYKRQMENYSLFDKWMREGRSLADMERRLNEQQARQDSETFVVMEKAVSDEPSVAEAHRRLDAEKKRVLAELLARDSGYREARDAYREAVSKAYVEKNEEKAPEGA